MQKEEGAGVGRKGGREDLFKSKRQEEKMNSCNFERSFILKHASLNARSETTISLSFLGRIQMKNTLALQNGLKKVSQKEDSFPHD